MAVPQFLSGASFAHDLINVVTDGLSTILSELRRGDEGEAIRKAIIQTRVGVNVR